MPAASTLTLLDAPPATPEGPGQTDFLANRLRGLLDDTVRLRSPVAHAITRTDVGLTAHAESIQIRLKTP